MTLYEHIVTEEEVHTRIDKLLTELNVDHSRSQIQSWIVDELVSVNNEGTKANYRCLIGDEIKWTLPEEKELAMVAEDIPLEIVYEDDDLLVINKPRGMVIHPTVDHQTGTLVHALLHYTDQLSTISGEDRPGIVHRLDKDTSGLVVVAKNDMTHEGLVKQFTNREVERHYEGIVHGLIDHENGLIDAPIGRDPGNRLQMGVVDSGKPSITHFKVLTPFKDYTHIACQLETGRTHQIRVHLNYIGHPLLGDTKYTNQKTMSIEGQALFANSIGLTHPRKKEWMTFEIEQPIYFKEFLEKIEKMS